MPIATKLWTTIQFENGDRQELRVEVGQGYVGKAAETGKTLNIPFDLYDDPDSEISQQVDRQTGYRTCSLLCVSCPQP